MKNFAIIICCLLLVSYTYTGYSNFSQNQLKEEVNNSKEKLALDISNKIKNFKKFDPEILNDFIKFKSSVEDINSVIKIINEDTGSNINELPTDEGELRKTFNFLRKVQKYAPITSSYNELIESANRVDKNKQETIDDFYKRIFFFALDIGLFQANVFYLTSFKTVGILTNELKIYKIKELCGSSCLSFAMSKAYWTIYEGQIIIRENIYNNTG